MASKGRSFPPFLRLNSFNGSRTREVQCLPVGLNKGRQGRRVATRRMYRQLPLQAGLPVVVVKRLCLFCGVCVLACPGRGDFSRRRTRLKKGGGGPPRPCGCGGESGGARYYVAEGIKKSKREEPFGPDQVVDPPPYMPLSLQIVGRSPKPVNDWARDRREGPKRGHVTQR